jgi:hypothetical protein
MVLAVVVCLAGLLSWAHNHVVLFQQLSNLELGLDELEQTCVALAGRSGIPRFEKPRLALAATTAAVLMVCFGANAAAASECGSLWVDSSLSVSASPERQQAALSALVLLPAWVASTRCDLWAFYGFGGSSFTDAPFMTVKFPQPPAGVCPIQTATRNDLNVFRGPAEAAEQDREKKCEEYRLNEVRIHQQAVDMWLNEVREKLATYSPVAPERTCILDLLQRVRDSDTTRFALVITDGAETCLPSFRGPLPAPSTHKHVVMVIISPERMQKVSSPGMYFSQMRHIWMTLAPWLSAVIPASRISDNTLGPAPSQAEEGIVVLDLQSKQH